MPELPPPAVLLDGGEGRQSQAGRRKAALVPAGELEAVLGEELFGRSGRTNVLTETEPVAFRYADAILTPGCELVNAVKMGLCCAGCATLRGRGRLIPHAGDQRHPQRRGPRPLAHELNQPLGIILSNAQAAQDLLTQEPPNTAEVQATLAAIVKADRRAGEVIERLRALLRGGQEWTVDGVVREALARLRSGCSAVPGLAS